MLTDLDDSLTTVNVGVLLANSVKCNHDVMMTDDVCMFVCYAKIHSCTD